jgi:hypothetical protein
MYVQSSIGSRNSAIHNVYHTSLRPSSLLEPRHLSLKVVSKAVAKTNSIKYKAWKPSRAEKPAAAGGKRLTPRGPPRFATLDYLHEESHHPREVASSHPEVTSVIHKKVGCIFVRMILPQVHLRKPCYDFSFL